MMTIKGWENRKLSDLANYINGYAFKPGDWGEEGLPIIRIEQLKNPDAPTDYFAGQVPDALIIDNGDLVSHGVLPSFCAYGIVVVRR